jgi:hypothetical protein
VKEDVSEAELERMGRMGGRERTEIGGEEGRVIEEGRMSTAMSQAARARRWVK